MSIHVHLPEPPRVCEAPSRPPKCYRTALWADLRARRPAAFHPLATLARAFRRPPRL